MSKTKRLSFKEIAKIIRARKPFSAPTSGERKDALLAASALNIEITTRQGDDGAFKIFYL